MPYGSADYKVYEILLMGEFYAFFGWILMRAVRQLRLTLLRSGSFHQGKHDAPDRTGRLRREKGKSQRFSPDAGFLTGPVSAGCWTGSMITILFILPLQSMLPRTAGFFLTLGVILIMSMVIGFVGQEIVRRHRKRTPMPFSAFYAFAAGLAGFEAAYELQPHLRGILGVLPLVLDWALLMLFYLPFVYQVLNFFLGLGGVESPIGNRRSRKAAPNRQSANTAPARRSGKHIQAQRSGQHIPARRSGQHVQARRSE